jgi:hypothetical protein
MEDGGWDGGGITAGAEDEDEEEEERVGGGGIIAPVRNADAEDEEGVDLTGAWSGVGLTAARFRFSGRGLLSPEDVAPAGSVACRSAGVLVRGWCEMLLFVSGEKLKSDSSGICRRVVRL